MWACKHVMFRIRLRGCWLVTDVLCLVLCLNVHRCGLLGDHQVRERQVTCVIHHAACLTTQCDVLNRGLKTFGIAHDAGILVVS